MFISVVMSAYNAEKYIAEAIESVLKQTYQNFEFVIIDDGSTDNSLSIIKKYHAEDSRIVIHSQKNMGLGNALNKGIEIARGEWIARMDADDIMLPNRLEEQAKYLEAYPEVSLLGSWAYYINIDGKIIGNYMMPNNLQSKEDFLQYFATGQSIHILHPTVIMNKALVQKVGGYKPIMPGQDTELWNRMAEQQGILVCMPMILMKYRMHSKSIISANYVKSIEQDEWITECMKLRRQGKEEIPFEVFYKATWNKPWWERLKRKRSLYANYIYRNAALQYGNKNYIGFFFNLSFSLLLEPKRIIRFLNHFFSMLKFFLRKN